MVEYLTLQQIADNLNLTYYSIRNYIKAGKLRSYKFSNGAVRIRVTDYKKFCERCLVTPKEEL